MVILPGCVCCGCRSEFWDWQTTLTGSPDYWYPGSGSMPTPSWIVRHGLSGIANGTSHEANWYSDPSYEWTAVEGVARFGNVSACAMRFVVGYDPATKYHAFIEFESEGKQHQGTTSHNPSEYIISSGSQLLFGASEVLSAGVGNQTKYNYISANDYSACADVRAVSLTDAGDVIRWCAIYKLWKVKIGFFTSSGETALFSATIPSCNDLHFWLGCHGGVFSAAFYERTSFPGYPISQLGSSDLKAYVGNYGFAGSFTAPSGVSGIGTSVGFGLRAPSYQSPRSISTFGVNLSNEAQGVSSTSSIAQFPSGDPAFTFSVPQIKVSSPSQRLKLPCADSFPDASLGYSGASISSQDESTDRACVLPVKNYDSGQFYTPATTYSGLDYTHPFLSCSETQKSLTLTLTVLGHDGTARASGQAAMDALSVSTLEQKIGWYHAFLVSGSLAGTHTLSPVTGRLAMWSMDITSSMSCSIKDTSYFYFDHAANFLSGRFVVALTPTGWRWRIFACLKATPNYFGGTAAHTSVYGSEGQYSSDNVGINRSSIACEHNLSDLITGAKKNTWFRAVVSA